MSDANELKNENNLTTLNLVLLAIATAGLFPLLWMYTRRKTIARHTGQELGGDLYIIWLAVCIGWSSALSNPEANQTLQVIAGLFSIAGVVLYIVWAFKARSALQEYALSELKVELKMNPVYTFLLTIYYVNYCINDIPELKRKQEVLSGNQDSA